MLAEDREGHVVRPEEELERAGQRTNHIIGTRGVLRIVGCIEQWFPGRVASRLRVAVIVALPNGGDRSPEDVVTLTVPSGDDRISDRQRAESQQPRIVPNILRVRGGDLAARGSRGSHYSPHRNTPIASAPGCGCY
jgi:hypothetical protein